MLTKLKSKFATMRKYEVIIMLAPIVVVILLLLVDDDDEFAKMGTTSYAGVERQSCSPGSFLGQKGATYGEETPGGIKYNVRTPLNYDATIAHPLLVVYAPAQANRAKTERMTGLTYQATSLGFIVAYADHPELSTSSTVELGSIPEQVAKKWCIDKKRIYLTGHSDGGTVAMALAFMNGTRHIPSAIAPSAAGVSYRDLKTHSCPEPISVMVMHSKNDHLFPGYGSEASGWWAACNDCSPIPKTLENGCIAYTDCKNEVKTWYCEGEEIHAKWPQLNNVMLKFLASSRR